jgi:hypothetical protein
MISFADPYPHLLTEPEQRDAQQGDGQAPAAVRLS